MNEQEIIDDLYKWIKEFVEKPNPYLNDWAPCPYARQARISNKIEVVYSEPLQLALTVEKNLNLLDNKDVIIICFDHTRIDPVTVEELAKVHNSILIPRDYVILEDHPDSHEFINGVSMNFGKCGLLLVQRLSKLTFASEQLKQKGYYDIWSEENYNEVVSWRQQ